MKRVVLLCVVLVAGCAFASAAGAAPPTTVPYGFSDLPSTLQGVCSFDVGVESTVNGTETFFSERSGSTRIEVHQVEVDTFSANGVTLTGEPFTTNIQAVIDANGNLVSEELSGQAETVVLPDGTVFQTAGRTNALVWPPNNPNNFFVVPQVGSQGNVAAFCAALS